MVVLSDQQRLTRAIDLHGCLCDIQPRAGAGRKFILRDFEQSFEQRNVRFARCDLRRCALGDHVKASDGGGNVILCLLCRVTARRDTLASSLISAQRCQIEELHCRGDLRVRDVEGSDDRRQTRK